MLLADYTYKLQGLELDALDISSGAVVTRLWTILKDGVADGTFNTSTINKVFSNGHVYSVTLLITNAAEETSSLTLEFVTVEGLAHVYQTIFGMVETLIQGAILNPDQLASLRTKWQNLLWEATEVPLECKYFEPSWPYLGNMLIAYVIVRDLAVNSANELLVQQGSAGTGTMKKIVTGPTEAEWQDPSKIFNQLFQKEGIYEVFMDQICALAANFKVHISGCKENQAGPLTVIYSGDYTYEHKYIQEPPEFHSKPQV